MVIIRQKTYNLTNQFPSAVCSSKLSPVRTTGSASTNAHPKRTKAIATRALFMLNENKKYFAFAQRDSLII